MGFQPAFVYIFTASDEGVEECISTLAREGEVIVIMGAALDKLLPMFAVRLSLTKRKPTE